LAHGVESEPPEQVLKVQGSISIGIVLEKRQETVLDLSFKRPHEEVPQGMGAELVAGELALGAPERTVDVEDAAAK